MSTSILCSYLRLRGEGAGRRGGADQDAHHHPSGLYLYWVGLELKGTVELLGAGRGSCHVPQLSGLGAGEGGEVGVRGGQMDRLT